MKTARQAAFEILMKIHRDKAYSNLALDALLNDEKLTGRESALTCALVYGVLERMLTLDYNLGKYLSQPIKKLRPEVLTTLRIGAYQLLYMDKIPISAAVNESVGLAKNNHCAFASGLVNAVLRKVSLNGVQLPDSSNKIEYLSIKYSCPQELVSLWIESYGEENTVGILENSFGGAPTIIRVNTTKITADKLVGELEKEGISAEISAEIPNAIIMESCGSPEKTSCYQRGLFHVQDTASQLCCKALDIHSGQTVIDVCSAPGGKSFTLAEMMDNSGKIKAFDIYEHRVKLIADGAKRLGLNCIEAQTGDATVFDSRVGKADRVLCDVPCSGLGIIRRKPEIRYKKIKDIDKLPELQYLILCKSISYLKSDGILVYSTCTLNPAENEQVCDRFLRENPDFTSVDVLPEVKRADGRGYLTLMPHINNSDGFFIAAFSYTKSLKSE